MQHEATSRWNQWTNEKEAKRLFSIKIVSMATPRVLYSCFVVASWLLLGSSSSTTNKDLFSALLLLIG